MLTTFYLAKNDHRWVIFIAIKETFADYSAAAIILLMRWASSVLSLLMPAKARSEVSKGCQDRMFLRSGLLGADLRAGVVVENRQASPRILGMTFN